MSDEPSELLVQVIGEVMPWHRVVRHLMDPHALPGNLQDYVDQIVKYVWCNSTCRLERGSQLYRARTHTNEPAQRRRRPFPPHEMQAPPIHKARANRLNPEGRRCLYAAEDAETAVAESRPYRRALVTVAPIEVVRDLTLAEGSFEDPKQELGLVYAWQNFISYASFSAPVHPESTDHYLPGQFLAEQLREAGLDGVRCGSAMRKGGVNVARFDPTTVEVGEPSLVEVQDVAFTCKRVHEFD
jgi:hypothetical protein